MLIVLDNARDSAQIVPLLPGSSTCTVLVTSRRQLASLVARHGARLVGLNVLMDTEAWELFVRHVGAAQVAAEPEAVAELLGWCAGLPLAIGIVAARAARHDRFPLAVLAEELREASARLDAMDGHELTVNLRAVFSWSYHALGPEQTRIFCLLGLSPGPDIGLSAAANLAGLGNARTRALLGEIEDASLILQPVPGRYQAHDLVRLYAAECADADLDPQTRELARRRLVDYYVQTAHIGDRVLHPHRDLVEPEPPGPGCRPDSLTTESATLAWFDAEHSSLMLVQQLALGQGWYRAAWQLAWTLDTFHWRRGHLRDDVTVWQVALSAASQLDEPILRVKAHRRLGLAQARIGEHRPALDHLRKALSLAEEVGDANELAHIHWCFAWAWDNQREDHQALEHAEHALRLFHELAQPEWEAETLTEMGRYCARLGRVDEARTHCENALAICREHDYREGEASVLDALGYVAQQAEQYVPAIDYYSRALALYRELGRSYDEPNVLDRLGHAHAAAGDRADAHHAWRQALDLYVNQHRVADAERIRRQLSALGEL
jgi:tetratricopeptide (TPR) repeat protein